MALPNLNTDLNIIQGLADRPNALDGLSAAQLKQKFDESGNAIKTFINDVLIPALALTTDENSGADNIGATAVTDLDGTTVQALIESVRNKLKATIDNASGADFVGATTIGGLAGNTVQALLEALKTYIDNQGTTIGTNYVSKVELTDTRKLDATANFTGSWHGISNPAYADPGIAGVVAEHTEQLADITINVKAYGAVGDWNGTTGTDDTAAIQAAIDALAGYRGELLFPRSSGGYLVSDRLSIGSNISINGQPGVYIKQSSPYKHVFHFEDDAENVAVRNIKAIGSAIRDNYYPTQSTMIHGLRIVNITIDGVFAEDFNEFVGLLQSDKINIKNSECRNMIQFDGTAPGSDTTGGYGVVLNGCNDVLITGNRLEAERHALYFSEGDGGCTNAIASNNYLFGDTDFKSFQNSYEYVVKIRNGREIKLLNNFVYNGYGGVIISTPTQGMIEIKGNTFQHTVAYVFTGTHNNAAIHVDSASQTAPCEFVAIEDNTIIDIANINAVYIDNAKIVSFKRNNIVNCLRVGTIRPEPYTNDTHLFLNSNYFDASASGLSVSDSSNGAAAFKFILFSDNMFSAQLSANPAVFGTNSRLNMQAMRNRVIGSSGYEVTARGTTEVTVVGFRYKDSAGNNKYIQAELFGTTAQRPTNRFTGMMYFDTTLSKPIWYKGTGNDWVDATGTLV